jgi:hypothetical protein
MKKKIIYLLFLALFLLQSLSPALKAQKIEIIPYAGYHTSAKIKSYEGTFRVNDGMSYGVAINLGRNAYKIAISYARMSSSLTYTIDNSTDPVSDMAIHFISLAGLLEFLQGNAIVPYVKVGLGGTYYQPINSEAATENLMHFNISGGTKIYLNEHFGFSMQASLLLPVFFEGLYFEEALPEPGEGMQTKVAGVMGDFKAGVLFRF